MKTNVAEFESESTGGASVSHGLVVGGALCPDSMATSATRVPDRGIKPLLQSVGALVALGLLTGCNLLPEPQVDPVRHFTLSTPQTVAPVPDATVVRPVQLAAHLRSRKMAVRIAEHEVIYLDEASWAEPLDDAILAVLRQRLATVGGGATVAVQVQRCELVRSAGNAVELAAAYTITKAAASGVTERRGVFVAKARVWAGKDHGQLIGLISQAVAELADALAVAVAENK